MPAADSGGCLLRLEGLNLGNNDIGPVLEPGSLDWCPALRAASFNNNDIGTPTAAAPTSILAALQQ